MTDITSVITEKRGQAFWIIINPEQASKVRMACDILDAGFSS